MTAPDAFQPMPEDNVTTISTRFVLTKFDENLLVAILNKYGLGIIKRRKQVGKQFTDYSFTVEKKVAKGNAGKFIPKFNGVMASLYGANMTGLREFVKKTTTAEVPEFTKIINAGTQRLIKFRVAGGKDATTAAEEASHDF